MKNFLNFIMISILMSILPISIDQNTDTTTIDKINSITEEKNITPLAIKPIDEHVIVLFEGENTYGSYYLLMKKTILIYVGGERETKTIIQFLLLLIALLLIHLLHIVR